MTDSLPMLLIMIMLAPPIVGSVLGAWVDFGGER